MGINEHNLQSSRNCPFNRPRPPSSPHPCVRQNGVRVVSAYRLPAGSSVRVGLNERGKRHLPLGTSCLLDGSLLGSSGHTAHLLIEGLFLGSDTGRPLIHVNK